MTPVIQMVSTIVAVFILILIQGLIKECGYSYVGHRDWLID